MYNSMHQAAQFVLYVMRCRTGSQCNDMSVVVTWSHIVQTMCAELVRREVDQVTKTLNAEFDVERTHHQKMLKDHSRLQQRLENLQTSVNLQLPISSVTAHVSRSPSNVSNLSTESESTSDKTEQVSHPSVDI